jgi:hypothetical protein
MVILPTIRELTGDLSIKGALSGSPAIARRAPPATGCDLAGPEGNFRPPRSAEQAKRCDYMSGGQWI